MKGLLSSPRSGRRPPSGEALARRLSCDDGGVGNEEVADGWLGDAVVGVGTSSAAAPAAAAWDSTCGEGCDGTRPRGMAWLVAVSLGRQLLLAALTEISPLLPRHDNVAN